MKKHFSLLFGLACLITIAVGCKRKKEPPMGFTPEQISALGPKMIANLCSGDYQCINAGTFFAVGAKSRIGGNWNAPPCPTFVTTTDGAQWQFQANCTCP